MKAFTDISQSKKLAEILPLEGRSIFPELCESKDEKIKKDIIDFFRHSVNKIPAQKFNKYIVWLEKQGEQKPAWSEEDDDDAWMNDIISKAENNLQLNKAEIDWLKSLKQRYTWKPSDEQLEFLQKCIEAYNGVTFPTEVRVLSSLYNDLKKLREG